MTRHEDPLLPGRQQPGLGLLRRRRSQFGYRQLRRDLCHSLLPDHRVRHLDSPASGRQLTTNLAIPSPAIRTPRFISVIVRSTLPVPQVRPSVPISQADSPLTSRCATSLTAPPNLSLANRCLKNAEDIFALADTSYPRSCTQAGSGTVRRLSASPSVHLMAIPRTSGKTTWNSAPPNSISLCNRANGARDCRITTCRQDLPHTNPIYYLTPGRAVRQKLHHERLRRRLRQIRSTYTTSVVLRISNCIVRSKWQRDPSGLPLSQSTIREQFLRQVDDAIRQSGKDPWGFGYQWSYGDTTSHGAGLSVMASEAYYITKSASKSENKSKMYDSYSQRWLANILGANPGVPRLSLATAPHFRIASSTRLRISRARSMALRERRPCFGERPSKVRPVMRPQACSMA